MRLEASDSQSLNYVVMDCETNKQILNWVWADDKIGEYAIYQQDENGCIIFDEDKDCNLVPRIIIKKERIKFMNIEDALYA